VVITKSLNPEKDYKMDMMNRKEEDINELTHIIIGCAMQVHRTPGNGRD
jgi:hypothetical protein